VDQGRKKLRSKRFLGEQEISDLTEKLAPLVIGNCKICHTHGSKKKEEEEEEERLMSEKKWRKLPFENDFSDVNICDNDILRVLTLGTEDTCDAEEKDMENKYAESDKEGEEETPVSTSRKAAAGF
jgi:hypothetical protein